MRPLLSGSPGCATLVTSRIRLAELPGSRLVHLEALGHGDALAMLSHIIGTGRARTDLRAMSDLVACCAGLPLAVVTAGARLNSRPQWQIKDLAERFRTNRSRLSELSSGDLAVGATIDLSYAALAGQRVPDGPPLTTTLQMLGLWNGADLGAAAMAAMLAAPEPATERTLEAALVNLSLVESRRAGRYRLHDLVHEYAAEKAAGQLPQKMRAEAIQRLLLWYLYGVDAANESAERHHRRLPAAQMPAKPDSAPGFHDVASASAWLEGERPNMVAITELAAGYRLHELLWRLPWLLEEFFFSRGHRGDWARTCEIGIKSARQIGGVMAEMPELARWTVTPVWWPWHRQ
ncbi:MAG TPA: hypothetical protein VGL63_11095 [Streptosporangiaceae bacterium]